MDNEQQKCEDMVWIYKAECTIEEDIFPQKSWKLGSCSNSKSHKLRGEFIPKSLKNSNKERYFFSSKSFTEREMIIWRQKFHFQECIEERRESWMERWCDVSHMRCLNWFYLKFFFFSNLSSQWHWSFLPIVSQHLGKSNPPFTLIFSYGITEKKRKWRIGFLKCWLTMGREKVR